MTVFPVQIHSIANVQFGLSIFLQTIMTVKLALCQKDLLSERGQRNLVRKHHHID